MILADFCCPVHGVFEALADADAEVAPCPVEIPIAVDGVRTRFSAPCEFPSPWSPSPVAGRVELVTATRGKWTPPPTRQHMDTTPMMEGQSYADWRKDRRAMWREHDHAARKGRGGV